MASEISAFTFRTRDKVTHVTRRCTAAADTGVSPRYFAENQSGVGLCIGLVRAANTLFGSLGQMDGYEVVVRVKIVLARFINHAQLTEFCRGRVGQDAVELSQLQRSRVVLVLNTDDKLQFSMLHH